MGEDDNKNFDKWKFFYKKLDTGEWLPLEKVDFSDSTTFSSQEEFEAHLWAMLEGLEIVPRDDK